MFDGAIIWVLCFIPGKLLVWIFGGGKYVTSFEDEVSNLMQGEDMRRREDGRIVLEYDFVALLGGLCWLGILMIAVVGYWTGKFDVVAPFRNWLFGKV